jgi:hypothetical protein
LKVESAALEGGRRVDSLGLNLKGGFKNNREGREGCEEHEGGEGGGEKHKSKPLFILLYIE